MPSPLGAEAAAPANRPAVWMRLVSNAAGAQLQLPSAVRRCWAMAVAFEPCGELLTDCLYLRVSIRPSPHCRCKQASGMDACGNAAGTCGRGRG
jgi:hypothetical protein